MKILDIPRSGSYQAITSSHNRAGQYVRNRRTPTQNPTARRTLVRAAMGSASTLWSGLTPTQQAQWIAFADVHPTTDALGQSIKLTGHQWFVAINAMLLAIGQSSVNVPPATTSVYSASPITAVFSLATGLAVTLSEGGAATDFALIALSAPVPAGRNYWAKFSQVSVEQGDEPSYALSTALYGAQFGAPAIGQKVFVRVTPVNAGGVRGVPVVGTAIVTA